VAQRRSNPAGEEVDRAKKSHSAGLSPKGSGEQESLTFDEAVAQLEVIIEKVESGEIGLEQALSEYERGVKLIRRCRAILSQAEQRIEELTGQADDQTAGGSTGETTSQTDSGGD